MHLTARPLARDGDRRAAPLAGRHAWRPISAGPTVDGVGVSEGGGGPCAS